MVSVVEGTDPLLPGLAPALIVVYSMFLFNVIVACYLLYHRSWPPIRARIPSLLVLPAFGSLFWAIGWSCWLRILPNYQCISPFFTGPGISIGLSTQMVRKYRYYNLLVRHRGKQWPPMAQMAMVILSVSWVIPLDRVLSTYDPETGNCIPSPGYVNFLYMPGYFVILVGSLWLNYRLRSVRLQFNEYKSSNNSVITLVVILLLFPVVSGIYDGSIAGDGTRNYLWGRPILMIYAAIAGCILSLHQSGPLAYRRWINDQEFLHSFTFGMASLPDPSLLSAELADQLYEPVLLQSLKRFAGLRLSQELVNFYEAVLEREATTDYFERQALSMKIIETFLRPGAEQEINITAERRRKVLVTDINRLDAFDDVKREVLDLMKVNLGEAYAESEERKKLQKLLEGESAEIALLKKAGLLPDLPSGSRAAAKSKSRSGSGSDGRGSAAEAVDKA